ncbi:MAG: hypothetical protein WC785_07080 [Tatlockia sp.]
MNSLKRLNAFFKKHADWYWPLVSALVLFTLLTCALSVAFPPVVLFSVGGIGILSSIIPMQAIVFSLAAIFAPVVAHFGAKINLGKGKNERKEVVVSIEGEKRNDNDGDEHVVNSTPPVHYPNPFSSKVNVNENEGSTLSSSITGFPQD